MTDSFCGYQGDRDEALVAFLYDDGGDAREMRAFEAHLMTCPRCSEELAELRGVRAQLARWTPPEPAFVITNGNPNSGNPQSAIRNPRWWREIPAWAQVAAALLVLGASAGIANLDVRYDANGVSVRTGWMTPSSRDTQDSAPAPSEGTRSASGAAQPGTAAAPWRTDLAALERQLTGELRAMKASTARPASPPDAEVLRRVRALVDESEKRQQRELALRVAEVFRDISAQRQADLVKIDRTLNAVENNLGVEVMKDRQKLNTLIIRASGRQ
jgi:anti-sigma factor RsiW